MTVPAVPRSRKRAASGLVLAAVVLCLTPTAPESIAQSKPERPPADQPELYPDGPHREETFYFCTACHDFKIVAAQGMSRARWNETLDFMVTRHNMPDVQGADRDRMLDYLASAFPERRQPGGWKNPFAPQ
jgi:hypothetical protein